MEVPGYVLHERIGTGSSSAVHRASRADGAGPDVAVKLLGVGVDAAAVRRLDREAAALARLGHPGIVQLLDTVPLPDGGVALVEQLVTGPSLADRLARQGPLSAADVADLAARVARALHAAHASGVVHRDLKPANILHDAEGQPVVADFGVALLRRGDRDDEPGWGTAEYLDPEVAAGGPADERSDLYALGVVAFEALTGTLPYAGSTPEATLRAADRGLHVPLAELAPEAPDRLCRAVERAMARRPGDRFGTAMELAGELEQVGAALPVAPLAGLAPGTRPATPDRTDDTRDPGPPPPPSRDDLPSAGTLGAPAPERSRTRRFGPRPPGRDRGGHGGTRRPRWVAVTALVAVVAIPALVLWSLQRDEPAREPVVVGDAAATASTAPQPLCDDAVPPAARPDVTAVPGDPHGRGCDVVVLWEAPTLEVPGAPGEPAQRFELGRDGDQLVMGDWDCDGRDTPALYRPDDGEVFLFDGLATAEGELTSRSAYPTGTRGGTARAVDVDDDGCDEVLVGAAEDAGALGVSSPPAFAGRTHG